MITNQRRLLTSYSNVIHFAILITLITSISFVLAFTPITISYYCHLKNHHRHHETSIGSKLLLSQSLQAQPTVSNSKKSKNKHLVLIGGGHAHLQVIKAFNSQSRPKDVNITVIDIQSFASYSGMVPGCIANFYTTEETEIDLVSLANWAGIDFIQNKVISINPETQEISLQTSQNNNNTSSSIIHYDVVSIDIGSTSRGLHTVPGAKEFTIPTRPISSLLNTIQNQDDIVQKMHTIRLVVVGGGLAGIELALALKGRWGSLTNNMEIVILNSGKDLVEYESNWCRDALANILKQKNIHIQHECHVDYIDKDKIHFNNGEEHIPYTHCLWATGAEAHSLASELSSKGIAINDRGWIRVHPTLQSISHCNIFAAGDCATIESSNFKAPAKAGVYAVRSGPILIENISKILNGCETSSSMVEYKPQDDFLKLIACGDGTALGFRFGIPLQGRWVWKLKDTIDTMFMDLFRVEKLSHVHPHRESNDGVYDTSQYDEKVKRKKPLPPKDGANLLLNDKDDNVDFELAWDVLRDMMDDENYRDSVLRCLSAQRIDVSS